jgi:hypothetical protein
MGSCPFPENRADVRFLEEMWHTVTGPKYITLYCSVTFHCIESYTQINKLIYSLTAYNAGHFLCVYLCVFVSYVEGDGS